MNTPLRPAPVFLEKPWGGRYLTEVFGAAEGTGEAWVVSNLSGSRGTQVQGIPLAQLLPAPLPLVKLLDCSRSLSVQLHPDDATARRLHGPGHRGKWEIWFFLRAPAEGFVYAGLAEDVAPAALFDTVRAGRNPEDLLHRVSIREGDTLAIPPGTVHALTQGSVVAEVQTPADLTYRIYDWGRMGLDGRPRELHLEWSQAMLRSGLPLPVPQTPMVVPGSLGRFRLSESGPLGFELLKTAHSPVSLGPETTRHALIFLGVEGTCELRSRAGAWQPEELAVGTAVVVPPGSGDLLVGGPGQVLLAYLEGSGTSSKTRTPTVASP